MENELSKRFLIDRSIRFKTVTKYSKRWVKAEITQK